MHFEIRDAHRGVTPEIEALCDIITGRRKIFTDVSKEDRSAFKIPLLTN